jgi:hypothetical protein
MILSFAIAGGLPVKGFGVREHKTGRLKAQDNTTESLKSGFLSAAMLPNTVTVESAAGFALAGVLAAPILKQVC